MAQLPLFTNYLTNQQMPITPAIIGPNPLILPSIATYTLQSTDYLRAISSSSAGGTLTVTFPSGMPSGFIFYLLPITNQITLTDAASGNVISSSLGVHASVTTATLNLMITCYSDSTNIYLSI